MIAMMLLFIVLLLVMIAFILLFDRKVWAAVQLRRGPNVVGPYGLLQSFADLFKFVFKEVVIPAGANKGVFLLAPLVTTTLALGAWVVVPVADRWVFSDINVGILYIFAISSLGVYGIIMGGWASNSKYPFLGALRSAAQMVSYEVSIGFVIITVLADGGLAEPLGDRQRPGRRHPSLVPVQPRCCRWPSSSSSRRWPKPTARPSTCRKPNPNSSPASWSNTRRRRTCSSCSSEYVSIVLMCAMMTILFLGGWHPPLDVVPFTWVPGILWFILKIWVIFFLFAMVKAIVPRYRYDQLMRIGWKFFLPISLFWVVFTAGYLLAFDMLPGAK